MLVVIQYDFCFFILCGQYISYVLTAVIFTYAVLLQGGPKKPGPPWFFKYLS